MFNKKIEEYQIEMCQNYARGIDTKDLETPFFLLYGKLCYATDFAILCGTYVEDDNRTYYSIEGIEKKEIKKSFEIPAKKNILIEEEKADWQKIEFISNQIKTSLIDQNGNQILVKQDELFRPIRMAISGNYFGLSTSFFEENCLKYLVEYGEYPQTITSKHQDEKLKEKLKNKKLKPTGKAYSLPNLYVNKKNKKYKKVIEYIDPDDNKKYILMQADIYSKDGKSKKKQLSNGRIVEDKELVFVNVESIKWILIPTSKKVISLYCLNTNISPQQIAKDLIPSLSSSVCINLIAINDEVELYHKNNKSPEEKVIDEEILQEEPIIKEENTTQLSQIEKLQKTIQEIISLGNIQKYDEEVVDTIDPTKKSIINFNVEVSEQNISKILEMLNQIIISGKTEKHKLIVKPKKRIREKKL